MAEQRATIDLRGFLAGGGPPAAAPGPQEPFEHDVDGEPWQEGEDHGQGQGEGHGEEEEGQERDGEHVLAEVAGPADGDQGGVGLADGVGDGDPPVVDLHAGLPRASAGLQGPPAGYDLRGGNPIDEDPGPRDARLPQSGVQPLTPRRDQGQRAGLHPPGQARVGAANGKGNIHGGKGTGTEQHGLQGTRSSSAATPGKGKGKGGAVGFMPTEQDLQALISDGTAYVFFQYAGLRDELLTALYTNMAMEDDEHFSTLGAMTASEV